MFPRLTRFHIPKISSSFHFFFLVLGSLFCGGFLSATEKSDSLLVSNKSEFSAKVFIVSGTPVFNTEQITASEIVTIKSGFASNKTKINVSEKVEVNKQLATHKQEKQASNPPKSEQKLIPFNKSSQDFLFGKDSFTISVTPTSQQFSKKHKSIYSHSENSTIFRLISLKTNVSTFVQLQKLNTYPSDFTSRPPPFS